jgi:hypothetical protein
MSRNRERASKYPQLDLISYAIGELETAERRLREAEMPECADLVRNAIEQARAEFTVHWDTMLRAEGRWREDEGSQRLQMAMARIYLGEV